MTASTELPQLPDDLIAPRWGAATLADVMPAVLRGLEVAGSSTTLIVPAAARYVVLLIDGLGLVDLRAHATVAPYLSSLSTTELTAGFPSTTVSSLTSLATGLPSGEHGLPGYTTWDVERRQALHWLGWHPVGSGEDLREDLPPEQVQPRPTAWERAEAAGVSVAIVNGGKFEGTGLTRAAFRGGRYVGTYSDGDSIASVAAAADRGHRSLVYCYLSQLDLMGHVRGPGSEAWVAELALVDRYAEVLAAALPPGTVLLVTGDHGMVEIDRSSVVDLDEPDGAESVGSLLRRDLVGFAGEPRMRHVHTTSGAATDVFHTWQRALGDLAWVLTRDDAINLGLFGPTVTSEAARRIGDVIAIARGRSAVLATRHESRMSAMPGHHGSLTDRDLLVPLAVANL